MKKTAFLSCAVVGAAGLLAAPAAMATGSSSSSCSASPSIQVVPDSNGIPTPCAVTLVSGQPRCAGPNEAAEFTGIRYKNTTKSKLDHVATLVTRNNDVIVPSSTQVITNCEGDPVTQLGRRTCSSNAVKINGVPAGASFWVVVKGRTLPVETTIATKPTASSSTIKCFPIAGLGLTASSDQLIQQVQRVTSQDGCAVDFITDSLTGEVLSARLTQESLDNGCISPNMGTSGEILPSNASDFEMVRKSDDKSFGTWKFGEGYIRSGQNSCTTRVIGGRVYTWGDPCPE